ncbi:hypothetical protein G9A89_013127 [Geosiphon pyriformis]|nr:hypothetical protein G9A89_013127 [Geosiphon pyriformis]
MATDGIANQMAGQKKVLVKDIPLGISDREVEAAMKEFGEQLAVVEFNNQKKATRAVNQWSTLIRKDAVRIYPMIEAKLVGLPQNCAAHYLTQSCFIPRTSRNYTRTGCAYIGFNSKTSHYNATDKLLVIGNTLIRHLVSKCPTLLKKKEGNTKKDYQQHMIGQITFGGKSYAKMVVLNPYSSRNNVNPSGSQKTGSQMNEMAKLLNAVALKLGVTVEKKNENRIMNQSPSYISEKKKEEDNKKGLFVIKAARQNVLATFPLKNTSNKLSLAAFGSFFLSLAGSSSPVKVPSKKHTWVSPSVVFTISKSPKIFNNRPVNKLVFSTLITSTTTITITASQMAAKAKNSKKQQQAVTTAMVTPNLFVVPNEIFSKISTTAASPIPDMDGNSIVLPDVVLSSRSLPIPEAKQSINPDDFKDCADQMEMESTVSPPVSGASDASAWVNVNGRQKFSGWVASNLVSGAMFKIKMSLLGSLFQLLPGCIGLKTVSQDAVKLFCVEFASQKSLNSATKITLKIAQSSGVVSVSSSSLSVALCNVLLSTFSDDIKTALGIFGVVTFVKLKPAGLWQYAVVKFKDISFAAAALSNWSVLVRKDSVRILPIVTVETYTSY